MNKPIGLTTADIYLRFPEIMEDEANDLADFLEDEHIVYEGATDVFMEKDKEIERLNNIINEIQWKPIDEYFKNKEKYDWVLVKYYDKYNFECIPSVAEYRFDKWYLKDNEKSLQDFEVRYFFDMQQLNKLKELKESGNNE